MTTPRNLKTVAGCATRVTVTILPAPENAGGELTAYVQQQGGSTHAAVLQAGGQLIFPPLPAGEHLYEIRCDGRPICWGHLFARQSAYPPNPTDVVDWELAADLSVTDAAQITLTLTPGPQGPKGDPGDITLDELPQENSTNFVNSGSVYTYVNYASGVILSNMQEFYDDYWAHSNNSYQEKHVTAAQLGILSSLQSGTYGSPGVSGSLTLLQGGIALNSPDATVKVEVRNSGLVLTSPNAPQWLEAASSQFFHLRTTKDLTIDDSDFLALSNRLELLRKSINSLAAKHPGEVEPVWSLRSLAEADVTTASAHAGTVSAVSVSNGTLSITNGGGINAFLLPADIKHFEASTTANQKLAVLVAVVPGDASSGGAGVFLCEPGNGANIAECSSLAQAINNSSQISGTFSKTSNLPSARLVVDIIDMSAKPDPATGHTHRVRIRLGDSLLLDTYLDAGLGDLSMYTSPRIGIFASWSRKGLVTLTDCKIAAN